jgi:hypothetical protein
MALLVTGPKAGVLSGTMSKANVRSGLSGEAMDARQEDQGYLPTAAGGAPTEGLFDFNQCVLLRFGSL